MEELFVGVDLGGTKIYTALSDKGRNILNEIIIPTEAEKGPSHIVDKNANAFDPDMIVVGGGVAGAGQIVFDKINEEMERRCLKTILNNCKVVRSKLGDKVGILGALALAMIESK